MNPATGALIHIHGVSVGEILSAVPLIERLLARDPQTKLLLTSWTKTAQAQAKRLYGDNPRVALDKLPLDLPWNHKTFYEKHAVRAAIWIDSEIWPGWLLAMKKRRIPSILINGRMSERSWKRWRMAKPLIAPLLSLFKRIDAQSPDDAKRFNDLGATATVQPVNLKYLRPAPLLNGDAMHNIVGKRVCVAYLFTHDGDETRAMEMHTTIKKSHADLLTLIVPRHPERTDTLLAEAQALNLNAAKRSEPQSISSATDILFGDTIGETGLYLALSDIVVMGKSFDPDHIGGQSPIEAAQSGKPIICGPYMTNFPGVMADLRQAGAVREIDAPALATTILHYLAHPNEAKALGDNAKRMADERMAIGDAYLSDLIFFLEKTA